MNNYGVRIADGFEFITPQAWVDPSVSRLAVPEKRIGLTLTLAFFDRCGNCVFASSATGSAKSQFPLGGGANKEVMVWPICGRSACASKV